MKDSRGRARSVRLLACDLDGTLLGPGDTGLETAREVLNYCKARGVGFTIATGRVFGAVERFLRYLGLSEPVITNGGAIVAAAGGKPLMERVIDPRTAAAIAQELKRDGLPFYFITGKTMVTEWDGPETAQYAANLSFEIRVAPSVAALGVAPTQVAVRVPPQEAPLHLERFRNRWSPGVKVLQSMPHLIEIQAEGVSKAGALEFLAHALGIARDEVLAVGDSLNDLDMLEWAGRSACVKNACSEVAAVVDTVAKREFAEGVLEIAKNNI